MPSKKRPLQESKPNVVKRVRLSEPELQDFEKPVLIAKVIALQDELENASAAVMEASKPPTESPEQIAEKVERVRKLIIKGILSQMKDVEVFMQDRRRQILVLRRIPSAQVFNALTAQPADRKKQKKQLSFTADEFQNKVSKEKLSASVRYDYLCITSKTVNVKWKEEDQTFTVTGSYGKTSEKK